MLGDRIKNLRIQKHITQEQLASHLKVAKSTIGMWENNRREPDIDTISKISNFFEYPIAFLLNETVKIGELYSSDDTPEHCCPICGYNYIYLKNVVLIDFFNSPKSSGYMLDFIGECSHHFYIIIENFKGNNYMTYTDTNFNVIKPVIPQEYKNSINGENNVQAINSGNNSQVNINSSDSSMNSELLELFNNLPLIKKAEVILMINKMKEEK